MEAPTWRRTTSVNVAAAPPLGTSRSEHVSLTPVASPHVLRSMVDNDARGRGAQIRVVICDDHPLYRLGLLVAFSNVADMVVTGECFHLLDAWNDRHRTCPDLLLVAQKRSGGTVDLIRRFAAAGTGVVVLAESAAKSDVLDALRAGARGYLPRDVPTQQLLEAVRAVCRHEILLYGDAAEQMEHSHVRPHTVPAQPAASTPHLLRRLTARQREVARLVADGLSNAEVATELFVSQATVKSHLTIILKRLNLRDRTQLAILMNRSMQVDPLPRLWDS